MGLLKSLFGICGDSPPDAGVGYVNGAKEVGGGRGGDAPEEGAPLPHTQRAVRAQLTRLLLGVGPSRTIRTPVNTYSVANPDPVGSETFCRIWKKSFRIRAARTRNENETKVL